MQNNRETVFEIGGEGGGIAIIRQRNKNGDKFFYHHSEFGMSNDDPTVNKSGEYDNFETPFKLINDRYEWFGLILLTVHEDYKEFVRAQLIQKLNQLRPEQSHISKEDLEAVLNIKLEYGYPVVRTLLQNIKVTNLIKATDYQFQEITSEAGSKYLKVIGKYEACAPFEDYNEECMNFISKFSFSVIGKLEVSSNLFIIKNESDQIEYVLSPDKFFVTASPVFKRKNSKEWFYTIKRVKKESLKERGKRYTQMTIDALNNPKHLNETTK